MLEILRYLRDCRGAHVALFLATSSVKHTRVDSNVLWLFVNPGLILCVVHFDVVVDAGCSCTNPLFRRRSSGILLLLSLCKCPVLRRHLLVIRLQHRCD